MFAPSLCKAHLSYDFWFLFLGNWVIFNEDFVNLNELHGRKDHVIEVRSYLPVTVPGLSVRLLSNDKVVEVGIC